jgi:hypothetical protein
VVVFIFGVKGSFPVIFSSLQCPSKTDVGSAGEQPARDNWVLEVNTSK